MNLYRVPMFIHQILVLYKDQLYWFPLLVFGRGPTQSITIFSKGFDNTGTGCITSFGHFMLVVLEPPLPRSRACMTTAVASKVIGYRAIKGGRKWSSWWAGEIKEAAEDKKRAYNRMLQGNVTKEIKGRIEYKSWNKISTHCFTTTSST